MANVNRRRAGSAPGAAVLVVIVVGGIIAWIVATYRTAERASVAADEPAVVEEVHPSMRVAIPEVREPTPLELARRLLERARKLAAGNATEREEALMAYARAEDALREVSDDELSSRDRLAIETVQRLYLQCIEESDALVYALFDEARIARTPWRDLLALPNPDVGHAGLGRFDFLDGEIHAVGAPVGSKREGLLALGDGAQWRDFVLETRFVIRRGESRFYWRAGKELGESPDELLLAKDSGFALDQTYTLTARYLGSRRTFTWDEADERASDSVDLPWKRNRVGGFAVVLQGDAELRITGLRIRVMRAGR